MATPKARVTAKAAPFPPAKQAAQAGGGSSSDSDSSSGEEEEEEEKEEKTTKSLAKKQPKKVAGVAALPKAVSTKKAKAESSSSSSSEDSSEEDKEVEKPKMGPTARPQAPEANGTSVLTAHNGKSDEVTEEEEGEKKKATVAVAKPGLCLENLGSAPKSGQDVLWGWVVGGGPCSAPPGGPLGSSGEEREPGS